MKISLRSIVQRVPNSKGIHAPSRLEEPVEIDADALASYSETAKAMPVSLEDDGISNPQQITAYLLPTKVETESGGVDIWPGRYVVEREG